MKNYKPTSTGLLQPLEPWLKDSLVSEILINKPKYVCIEKNNEFHSYFVDELSISHLERLFQLIANENNQQLSTEFPILAGSLKNGDRVQLCLPCIATNYILAIRKKVLTHCTLDELKNTNIYQTTTGFIINKKSICSTQEDVDLLKLYNEKQWAEFIKKAIQYKKNIVISGATSSGKTTFLNACLQHIDINERLIVLEDTRELNPPHDNLVKLLATKDSQGSTTVTMQELVQCSLRLRPDRIIMGEIRGREIIDFISACSTGHQGSLTSIHASSPKIAFLRMMQMYKLNQLPAMTDKDIIRELTTAIDIIIQLARTSQGRKVTTIYYKNANNDNLKDLIK